MISTTLPNGIKLVIESRDKGRQYGVLKYFYDKKNKRGATNWHPKQPARAWERLKHWPGLRGGNSKSSILSI